MYPIGLAMPEGEVFDGHGQQLGGREFKNVGDIA
jgi:hypothetical protein